MKEIQLTQGKVALVDDADYGLVNSFKWHTHSNGNGCLYAVRYEKKKYIKGLRKEARAAKKKKYIGMHNFILKPGTGMISHHKNGYGLDNQRHNLEECTELKNQQYAAEKTNDQ